MAEVKQCHYQQKMAPGERLELPTYRLTAGRAADCAIQDCLSSTLSEQALETRPIGVDANITTHVRGEGIIKLRNGFIFVAAAVEDIYKKHIWTGCTCSAVDLGWPETAA
jgi:hypothetical protein